MTFGICCLSVVPLRSRPVDKGEMVSQLLFGETFEIFSKKGRWWQIRCVWDNVIGWVDKNQVQLITPAEFEQFQCNFAYCLEILQPAMGNTHYLPIPIGARLPAFDGLNFFVGQNSYVYSGQVVFPKEITPTSYLLIKIAKRYLFAPFILGGRSPLGIDSSGLIQVVFGMLGLSLPRYAAQQVAQGEMIDFVEQSQAGDLAFFENKVGAISHVGIVISENEILHAFGRVRIDKIDHFGIFCEESKRYTHKLRVVKRFLPKTLNPPPQGKEEKIIISNQTELF